MPYLETDFADDLWDEFSDVPIDDEGRITCEWRSFDKGTSREEIWQWFEKFFEGFSVANKLYA